MSFSSSTTCLSKDVRQSFLRHHAETTVRVRAFCCLSSSIMSTPSWMAHVRERSPRRRAHRLEFCLLRGLIAAWLACCCMAGGISIYYLVCIIFKMWLFTTGSPKLKIPFGVGCGGVHGHEGQFRSSGGTWRHRERWNTVGGAAVTPCMDQAARARVLCASRSGREGSNSALHLPSALPARRGGSATQRLLGLTRSLD